MDNGNFIFYSFIEIKQNIRFDCIKDAWDGVLAAKVNKTKMYNWWSYYWDTTRKNVEANKHELKAHFFILYLNVGNVAYYEQLWNLTQAHG